MRFAPGLWIALRYSFARKRFRVINIISAISLTGIILGVSTLLVVMSVLNGFQQIAWDLFVTVESPAQVLPAEGTHMEVPDSLLAQIGGIEGVVSAEPFAEGSAILSGKENSELVMVKGISRNAHDRLMKQTGREMPYFSRETVSVGEVLAYKAKLAPAAEVKIFSPELIALGLQSLSQPYLLPALTFPVVQVESVFSLQRIFNDHYVLTSREMARRILLQEENLYSGIDVRGSDDRATHAALVRNLRSWVQENGLEDSYVIRPLEEKYRDIFGVMEIEKWVSFSVLMLVIVVAALSLTGSLTMTAIDKRKELFYLRCLGLEKPQFIMIFIMEGGMIGFAGTAIGAAVAWVICSVQKTFGLIELPSKSAFIIEAYPVSMQTSDFVVVSVATIAVSLLVSLYPAFKAAGIAGSKNLSDQAN
ncbi:FtsX-like permease family protein [Prosthecochloris sp.]|uniref:FtsX-like permease family protein n=1 Tax=Prosthecochloris sp. TaxID=290513 RepID=UPI00257E1C34|nr:FtsX-like permease family protein [Prosthecochloris sp.]